MLYLLKRITCGCRACFYVVFLHIFRNKILKNMHPGPCGKNVFAGKKKYIGFFHVLEYALFVYILFIKE